jgi:ABC-type multidrug transport system fused ATPase/permease subunit
LSRRDAELKEMKKGFYLGTAPIRAAYQFFPAILSSVVLATYIGTGHQIDLATTFTILVLLELIKDPMLQLPGFTEYYFEYKVSMMRIQAFLDIPEVPLKNMVKPSEDEEWAVQINRQSFSWGVKTKVN